MTTPLPRGFSARVANLGIKDASDDFVVVDAGDTVPAAAVFTRSLFAGPSVTVSREHASDGRARGVVVISKNANVATGTDGDSDAREVVRGVAAGMGCDPADVLIASTGVIGRRYPMERIRTGLAHLAEIPVVGDADSVARAIMTTDTRPKVAAARVAGSEAAVVGVAKGVGMIEPDMATLICLVFTDADVASRELDLAFRASTDATLNCLSVDGDTSTSDTAVILANGAAGPVDQGAFAAALGEVMGSLARQIARDGEGATKLLEVVVTGGRDDAQAKRVAKSVVNSPLVKTAVHGADPNWGRVAMAVGKCSDDTDIDQGRVRISFGDQEVYPSRVDDAGLAELSRYMSGDEVRIRVDLAIANGAATVWGCDLSAGYVRINADYTT